MHQLILAGGEDVKTDIDVVSGRVDHLHKKARSGFFKAGLCVNDSAAT